MTIDSQPRYQPPMRAREATVRDPEIGRRRTTTTTNATRNDDDVGNVGRSSSDRTGGGGGGSSDVTTGVVAQKPWSWNPFKGGDFVEDTDTERNERRTYRRNEDADAAL